jgi:UDP-N-acetylmuramate--alanine ligase
MSAIARLLLAQGVVVSGSDHRSTPTTDELAGLGAIIALEHAAANVDQVDLVVHTAAVGEDNPEIAEARRRSIPVLIRAEMVARLIQGKRVIAVAGTHGKTTISTLVSLILRQAGQSPTYLLGGDSLDLGPNAAWGEGPACVVEADEFRSAFLEYDPDTAVISNVDPDHLEYFGTVENYRAEFDRFVNRIKPGGTLLACVDDKGSEAAFERAPPNLVRESYGLSESASWSASNVRFGSDNVQLRVLHNGEVQGNLTVQPPGQHMVENALAAVAVTSREGVDFQTISAAIRGFQGARRRFELVGEGGGITVVDDYAHHPTEVRTVLATARARFGTRRFVVVYQPLTYTRIEYLWDDWVNLWSEANELVVLETFGSREQPQSPSASDLVAAITTPKAIYAPNVEDAARQAVALARSGDVVLTVGADEVCEVGPRVVELLQ